MTATQDYAGAVMRRSRVPMEPADFVPDWRDRPRKAKFFPTAELLPLPDGDYPAGASVDAGLAAGLAADPPAGRFDLDLLGGMLRDSYGFVGRRLGIQGNSDLPTLPAYPEANYSRGSASGGGLYPVSVYWAAGPSGPLLPGLYHYSPYRHGLERLAAGDVTEQVRAATGVTDTDQFLIQGVQFWQNSFKYASFAYHVVTMDNGALLQTWRMWAGARGLPLEALFWFEEPALTTLLGVDPELEGLFSVVPLRWAAGPTDGGTPAGPVPGGAATGPSTGDRAPGRPRVRLREQGRSKVHLDFPSVRAVHAATVPAGPRPAPGALAPARPQPVPAGGQRVPLPDPAPVDTDVRTALRARRSSFGRFTDRRPTRRDELAAILAAAAAGAALRTDVDPDTDLAALYVFANHVEGVAPGSYRYDPVTRELRLVRAGPPGEFLQANYFLANYNMEQAGAVIVPAIRTDAVVDAVGDRGYRLVTAAVGAGAQAVYTAAAGLGLGLGVALGFDSESYAEELGLVGTGEVPLLTMMVGHEHPRPADVVHGIAR